MGQGPTTQAAAWQWHWPDEMTLSNDHRGRVAMWGAATASKEGSLERGWVWQTLICPKQKRTKKPDKKSYPRPWQSICNTCGGRILNLRHDTEKKHMFSVLSVLFPSFAKDENKIFLAFVERLINLLIESTSNSPVIHIWNKQKVAIRDLPAKALCSQQIKWILENL